MKNESRIEELLAELLRSSDKQGEQLSSLNDTVSQGFQMIGENLNKNFTQIDENFKLISQQFALMNEKLDQAIALNEKVKTFEKRMHEFEERLSRVEKLP